MRHTASVDSRFSPVLVSACGNVVLWEWDRRSAYHDFVGRVLWVLFMLRGREGMGVYSRRVGGDEIEGSRYFVNATVG